MQSTRALIGLGSNLGDRGRSLRSALAELEQTPGIVVRAVSSIHETRPEGGPAGQGDYLNAAAILETTLSPAGLLRVMLEIESRLGRTREIRFGPRTIDLDLLLFGGQVLDEPGLIVPHPRFRIRRFVLGPLAEIAAKDIDPVSRLTVAELLCELDRMEGSRPSPHP